MVEHQNPYFKPKETYQKTFDGKNWATSYAVKPELLYLAFPSNKYIRKEVSDIIYSLYGHRTKHSFYGMVLRYFFKLILDDIIDNNVTFKLPPGTNAYLEMENVTGENFIKAYLNGAFLDVDYLASNFTGNNLSLRYTTRYGKWRKPIHVNKKIKDRITHNTNSGKQYG